MQFNSIKDVMIFWREKYSDKPVTWFARRAGISSSTFQRIFEGNTKNPDFSTGRSICLNALDQHEEAVEILIALYPEKKGYITEDAKSFRSVQHFKDPAILEAYADYYKWQILNLASLNEVSVGQLEELGKVYLKKAFELVHVGLLNEANQRFTSKVELGWSINGKILSDTVGHLARSLKEKSERGDSDKNGHIYFLIDGFSQNGKEEARKLILECSEKISNLRNKKENCGQIPLSIMMTLSDLV